MSESLSLGACLIDGGYMDTVVCATGSHFASAERQYRFPLELGCTRPPCAQWTVTGAGATVLSKEGNGPKITMATFGRVVDFGVTDVNNMGAAMAPAAADTLLRFFDATGKSPDDFDLIATGDLGYEGGDILCELMSLEGMDIRRVYNDCGMMIYSRDTQDTHAGGSGCGCSAAVLASYLLPKLASGALRRVLVMGTGAMMSPQSIQQGECIPAIAHLVCLTAKEEEEWKLC